MTALLDLLTAASILGCILRFAYRSAFEGADAMSKPPKYHFMRYKLDMWAGFGLLAAIPLLWWLAHWWVALLWVVAYMVTDAIVTGRGEKRFIRQITPVLRLAFPAMTEQELKSEAVASLEREKAMNTEMHDYL